MKRILAGLAGLLVVAIALVAGLMLYARSSLNARYSKVHELEVDALPVPWPLTDEEKAALMPEPEPSDEAADAEGTAGEPAADGAAAGSEGGEAEEAEPAELPDFDAIARERALERGERLAEVRLGCSECHGADYGGHVVADVPGVFTFVAPNLTSGKGGHAEYDTRDWVRILRHGINSDGTTSFMPAIDYTALSDRELSDLMVYVRSKPPVDRTMDKSSFGPAMWMAYTFGGKEFPVEVIDHQAARPKVPPEEAVSLEFGEHLAKVCVGCHRMDYSGGPMADGDPSWPDAANLTPHEEGLGGWSKEDFRKAMREGLRPDGTAIDEAMPVRMTKKMSDTELDALWTYLAQIPAIPTGK